MILSEQISSNLMLFIVIEINIGMTIMRFRNRFGRHQNTNRVRISAINPIMILIVIILSNAVITRITEDYI